MFRNDGGSVTHVTIYKLATDSHMSWYCLQGQAKIDAFLQQSDEVLGYPPQLTDPYNKALNPAAIVKSANWISNVFTCLAKARLPMMQAMNNTVTDPAGFYAGDHCHSPASKVKNANKQQAFHGIWTLMTSTDQVASVVETDSTRLKEVVPTLLEVDERCKLGMAFPGTAAGHKAIQLADAGDTRDRASSSAHTGAGSSAAAAAHTGSNSAAAAAHTGSTSAAAAVHTRLAVPVSG